jgi:hypothetical protein
MLHLSKLCKRCIGTCMPAYVLKFNASYIHLTRPGATLHCNCLVFLTHFAPQDASNPTPYTQLDPTAELSEMHDGTQWPACFYLLNALCGTVQVYHIRLSTRLYILEITFHSKHITTKQLICNVANSDPTNTIYTASALILTTCDVVASVAHTGPNSPWNPDLPHQRSSQHSWNSSLTNGACHPSV